MSSFLDKLKNKMTGSLSRPAPKKVEAPRKLKTTIRANRWDERVFKEARKTEPIDKFVNELLDGDPKVDREEFTMGPEMVRDLFMSVYKADPVLEHKRAIAREAYPVRKIMEEMLESPQLKELQEYTAGDAMMSTIATGSLKDAVLDIIVRLPPPPPPPGQGGGKDPGSGGQGKGEPGGQGGKGGEGQPDKGQPSGQPDGQEEGSESQDPQDPEAPEGENEGQDEGDGEAPEGEHEPDKGDPEWDPDAEEEEPETDQEEADWEAMYDELLDNNGLEMDIDKAIRDAMDEAEQVDNSRKGIGLEDGAWKSMSPEERLKIAERLRSPQMKELADVIGRMRRFALGVRATRLTNVPHEAFDVEAGDKIQRLLKGQFALLGDENTEYEFYRRLADKELLQFKMRGTEDAGKGPIVVCIDKSGSMDGKPFHWAMGVAEALRRFAADDERDYYAMFFGNNNDRNRFDFPKGKGPWEKIQAFLSVRADGGTQFDGVLDEALRKTTEAFDGEGKGKADILFITDGAARLTDEWIRKFNEERARAGVRVYSVQVGGAYDYYGGDNSVLGRFSDAVIDVKDLNPSSASAIFEKV